MEAEVSSDDLIKVNVYYTSMNQKSIEDKIDYSLEVELIYYIREICASLGWKYVQRLGWLPFSLAWDLLLQSL